MRREEKRGANRRRREGCKGRREREGDGGSSNAFPFVIPVEGEKGAIIQPTSIEGGREGKSASEGGRGCCRKGEMWHAEPFILLPERAAAADDPEKRGIRLTL